MGFSKNENEKTKRKCALNCSISDIRNLTIPTIEQTFYTYGISVAKSPAVFIILCVVVTAFASIGLSNFTKDKQSVRSLLSHDYTEHQQNFPINLRTHTVIYEADNVLSKEVLLEMLNLHEEVTNLATNKTNWNNLCFRVPQMITMKNKDFNNSPCSHELTDGPCLENSILQIWGYDRSLIESLSQKKILWDINNIKTDSLSGYPINVLELLGQIYFDEMGDIISAKSSMHSWTSVVDEEIIKEGEYHIDVKTGLKVDEATFEWEQELLNLLQNYKSNANVSISFQIASDLGFNISGIPSSDLMLLVYGIILVAFYAIIKVGRLNLIHQKPWTSICGLACVVKALLFSFGFCSTIGIPYGPANDLIPILLLGLCGNNMFIFSQSWSNLSHQEMKLPLHQRVGCMVRDAWLPITITFIVTLTVFLVGSLSFISAIRIFCLYAAISIAALYFFMATSFIAWFTVDQSRLEESRNGLLFCLKHTNWKPSKWSEKQYFQTLLYHLCSKFFRKQYFKTIILILTSLMATGSSIAVYNVQQGMDMNLLVMTQNSQLQNFENKVGYYYPFMGEDGHIIIEKNNLDNHLIESMINRLEKSQYIGQVQNIFENFKKYLLSKGINLMGLQYNELLYFFINHYTHKRDDHNSQISKSLKRSLKTNVNDNYISSTDLRKLKVNRCRSLNSTLLTISFKYRNLNDSKERDSAMNEVTNILTDLNLTDGVDLWSTAHNEKRMNKIIGREIFQIFGLTLLSTLLATLLLASPRTSILITLCVLFTLADVGCIIYSCGLTVNVITSLSLLVGIGLCIDYCVHVARNFMVYRGTRDERAHRTITSIGPAVIKGGLGSLISISLLIFTESYFFSTFFKVLLAAIIFGLFHALVFLPVALSLIGPEPFVESDKGHPANNISTFTMVNPKYLKTDPDENVRAQSGNVSLEDIPTSCSSSPEIGIREEHIHLNDKRASRGFIRPISPVF